MGLVRERLLLPILVILAALAAIFVVVGRERDVARERVVYEDRAFESLRALAEAQRRFHEQAGRYGWAGELEAAGLLRGLTLEDRDGYRAVVSPRYRLDVLLPFTVAPGNLIRIATRDQGHANRQLEREHFVVIARPWGDALTGFRTYYIDSRGNTLISEGVSDVASRARRPLPDFMIVLPKGYYSEVSGLRWWHLDALPAG